MPHALSRSPHSHQHERAWVGRGTKSVWLAEGVEGGNQAGDRVMNFLAAKGKMHPGVLLSQETFLSPSWSPSPRRRAHKQVTWLSQDPLCPNTPSWFSLPSSFLAGSCSHPRWLDHRGPPSFCAQGPLPPHLLAPTSAPPKPDRYPISPDRPFHNWAKSTCHCPRPK